MNLIVALCKYNNGIGINNDLPWHLKKDLAYFKKITSGKNIHHKSKFENILVMGRKTWESIPEKNKPLKNRINIILTKNNNIEYKENIENSYEDTFVKNDVQDIVTLQKTNKYIIYIIGGSTIYKEFLDLGLITQMYVTEVYKKFDCDTFFPEIDTTKFKLTCVSEFINENDIYFRNLVYSTFKEDNKWRNHEEYQYLNSLKYILNNGLETNDRTNVGTLSIFAQKFVYNLEDTFPALTTRRIFLKGIFEELMLYISGSTNNNILNEKNIHIWDGNTTREFLDKRKLEHYPVGDMGETYGFNFRHYGATYKNCNEDYSNQGFDQIDYVINLIKNEPHSRRIIINLWNPYTMHKAALPACLCFYQFYVNTKTKKLNLQIYIRSSDYFLANNWNTCTGALLVNMICNLKSIDLTPGSLTVITGDTHIYKNHIEVVKENLNRTPKPFGKLIFNNGEKEDLKDYKYEDIKLVGYFPDKSISAPMAV